MYIDQSGDEGLVGKENTRYCIFAGLIIPYDEYKVLQRELNKIIDLYFVRKEIKFKELHVSKLISNMKAKPPRHPCDKIDCGKLINEIYNLISHSNVTVIAAVIDKQKLYDRKKYDLFYGVTEKYLRTLFAFHVIRYGLSIVLSRFELFLRKRNSYGIAVFDLRKRVLEKHEELRIFQSLKEAVPEIGRLERIYELYGSPSNLSIGLQLCDFAAYAIFRKFEHNDETYFKYIEPKIDRREDGSYEDYGLKVYPK